MDKWVGGENTLEEEKRKQRAFEKQRKNSDEDVIIKNPSHA